MKIFNHISPAWLIIFTLLSTACKKNSPSSSDTFPAGLNVYMAGLSDSHVAYWKNGQLVDLGVNGNATGIAVSGSDVYVSANIFVGASSVAAYFKNNTQINLSGSRLASATGIAISGSDVYVIGQIFGPAIDTSVYWKNGVETTLQTDGSALLYDIAISGQDVYITGNRSYHIKNGNVMSDGVGPGGWGYAVTVAGSSLYFAGDSVDGAYYWKNKQPVKLDYTPVPLNLAYPMAITVSGSDVYTAGYIPGANNSNHAAYWKNGKLTSLNAGNEDSFAEGIALAGNDLYITGYMSVQNVNVPIYWKNGQLVRLGSSGYVKAMTVTH
ncbi:MAG: hypothetical protein JST68_02540 [Bacteroidetes bacterium]|nr:hypothetical protein [Bacteroidota bacterium]